MFQDRLNARRERLAHAWHLVPACVCVDGPQRRVHGTASAVTAQPVPGATPPPPTPLLIAFDASAARPRAGSPEAAGFRVHIDDPYVRDAAMQALMGAARWLGSERCQLLMAEFQDEQGQPLTRRLQQLAATPKQYLSLVIFQDGALHPTRSARLHGPT